MDSTGDLAHSQTLVQELEGAATAILEKRSGTLQTHDGLSRGETIMPGLRLKSS
jgi:hypothetical protein